MNETEKLLLEDYLDSIEFKKEAEKLCGWPVKITIDWAENLLLVDGSVNSFGTHLSGLIDELKKARKKAH